MSSGWEGNTKLIYTMSKTLLIGSISFGVKWRLHINEHLLDLTRVCVGIMAKILLFTSDHCAKQLYILVL